MFAPSQNPKGRGLSTKSGLSPVRQPFLYLTAALIAGIIVDRQFEPSRAIVLTVAIISIAVSIKLVIERKNIAATILLLASFATSGALLSAGERTGVAGPRLKRLFDERIITPDDPVELTGFLIAPPEPAPRARYLDVEAENIRTLDRNMIAAGCARLMIRLADAEATDEFNQLALDYGCRVRLLVRLERARSYRNPGSPDFNEFLERRGYDLKGTIKSSLLIEPLGRAASNRALGWLYHLRLGLMSAIDARFREPVAGTLKAMLAGNNYFLDPETSERLRESATFHTLVISGFHVSVIAWLLLRVPVSAASWRSLLEGARLRRRSVARALASMIALWAYAAMVGLAPPVMRAAVMITIGLIAPLMFRRAASVNTVALAAFIMLALKPALVADPGFQLSFVAVASIVGLALPLISTLRRIGEWRPVASAPHPPTCSRAMKAFAEILFWDERRFNLEMRGSPIRYRMDKSRAACALSRMRLQWLARAVVSLAITSLSIQLCALPLMAFYFNRVSPAGALLNMTAGLLTACLMLAAIGAIAAAHLSLPVCAGLTSAVNAAHYLLANSIKPFAGTGLATFRVAHYEGRLEIIYAIYFIPVMMLAVLIDRWRPVDYLFPIDRNAETKQEKRAQQEASVLSHLPANSSSTGHRCSSSLYQRFTSLLSPILLSSLALLACMFAVIRPLAPSPDGKLAVHFLDVGQGDAALIIFPHGTTMLIDAGGELRFDGQVKNEGDKSQTMDGSISEQERIDEESELEFNDGGFRVGEAVVCRFLWSQGRTRIDYALATHADQDHIGGLSDVLKNFRVGQAIAGHAPEGDPEFDRFRQSVRRSAIPLGVVSAGEQFEIDGVTVEVLWPPLAAEGPVTSGNNDSVALRLVYGSISILLAGDIERGAEEALIRAGVDLRADVLKVPHHGSKTSSTAAFIDRARPKCAVISVGERSRFGHPHAVVANRYLERGVRLFQTGRDGMVTVTTDGASLNVETYRR